MANLLSFAEQQIIKKISANKADVFDQINNEIENTEIRDLIGKDLLYALQVDNELYSPSEWTTNLLDGCVFLGIMNNNVKHRGLKFVIAYFNYSKYIGQSFATDTFSGFVQKTRTDAQNLSEGQMKRLVEDNRKIALSEWDVTREFLIQNSNHYPTWYYGLEKQPFVPKIDSIKKTNYGKSNQRALKNIDPRKWYLYANQNNR